MTDDEEARARHIEWLQREYFLRRRREAPFGEREPDLHALAWGRIARALEAGRNPSIDDLLNAIAADATIPQAVQVYAQRLLSREVKTAGKPTQWGLKLKPTGGPRPRWGPNHNAWQFTRDVILMESFEALRRDMERRGADVSGEAVFVEFARLRWGSKEAWGEMAAEADDRKGWRSETAHARYFEAKGRLDALRATDAEDL